MRIYCVAVLMVVMMAGSLAAAPAEEGPRMSRASIDDGAGAPLFPKVSRFQIRRPLPAPVSEFEPDYDSPPGEWNPNGGGGSSPWSLCKTNMACSAMTIGDCYEKTYSNCQSRVSGSGAPCQAC